MLALRRCRSTNTLTKIVLPSVVLLSQKIKPDALLSLKFPQPKLPVKTPLGEGGKRIQRKQRRYENCDDEIVLFDPVV